MNEITERFLKEIAERIGAERIEEIHLFPAVRQGIMESGVAVVAVIPEGDSPRHTVFSASYRNTVKGPERGRWEIDVTAEADAPLFTIEKVVKGVVQRAGEPFEPERISGSALRSLLGIAEPSTPEEASEVQNDDSETEAVL